MTNTTTPAADPTIVARVAAYLAARPGVAYSAAQVSNAPEFTDDAIVQVDRAFDALVDAGWPKQIGYGGQWVLGPLQ